MSDETVGYKKPPKAHQFAKSKSGNPRGRPKGSKNQRGLMRLLSKTVGVTVDGRHTMMPVEEALAMQVIQRGLKGDKKIAFEVLKVNASLKPGPQPEATKPSGDLHQQGLTALCVDAFQLDDLLVRLGILLRDDDGRTKIHRKLLQAAVEQRPELDNDADLIRELNGYVEHTKILHQSDTANRIEDTRNRLRDSGERSPPPSDRFLDGDEPKTVRGELERGSLSPEHRLTLRCASDNRNE